MTKVDDHQPRPRLDIVVPVYNEELVVVEFYNQLSPVLQTLPYDARIIFVDDGSSDKTLEQLKTLAEKDHRLTVIELSRNFGHQAALSAGLSLAGADFVITMDGDGQHPPALLPEMLALAEQGYDIVLTLRQDQNNASWFKRWTSSTFYRIINFIGSTKLQESGADFRLLNARAVLALGSMPEYHRLLRGMVAWMGFRTVVLPFLPEDRIAGKTKFTLPKMLRLAMDSIFSFSLVPLYFALIIGLLFLFLSFVEIAYVLSFWITDRVNELAPGWASLMFVLLFSGGSILLTLGIVGIYVGYIFQEVKHRPVYLIRAIYSAKEKSHAG